MGQFNFELVDPAELTGYLREIPFYDLVLEAVLPVRTVSDIEYRFVKGTLIDQDAAKFRQFDTEAPIGKRQPVLRQHGSLPPISKKIPLTEEGMLRLRALQTGDTAELVNQIYDDGKNMARSVAVRLELARAEVLDTGKVTLNENGVMATVDYGRSSSHNVVLSGAALWSAPSTATPITNLRAWHSTYRIDNGTPAGAVLMGETAINNLLVNAEVRSMVANVVNVSPSIITRPQLDTVLQSFNLPPIVQIDTIFRVDGSPVRAIPANRVIFIPPTGLPLGNTLMGVTAEATHLAELGRISVSEAPGIVGVVETEFDPVATWTKAAGIGLPVVANPDLTFAATVG